MKREDGRGKNEEKREKTEKGEKRRKRTKETLLSQVKDLIRSNQKEKYIYKIKKENKKRRKMILILLLLLPLTWSPSYCHYIFIGH